MSEPHPISFISDFGLQDEFVGVVHGVIARIDPSVKVIDVTHGIPAGDIRAGALALVRAIQYLPQGVALVVVDPGVGSKRLAVAVATEWGTFVGPDNGVLSPAVAIVGGASAASTLSNPDFLIPSAGATFEGRDRFGPAAAALASGQAELAELGDELDPHTLTPLMLPLPRQSDEAVSGEAWWVDRFGNVETNVGPEDLAEVGLVHGDDVLVRIGGTDHALPWVEAYSDVEPGHPLLIVDSAGLIAIAVRGGSASDQLGVPDRASVSFMRP